MTAGRIDPSHLEAELHTLVVLHEALSCNPVSMACKTRSIGQHYVHMYRNFLIFSRHGNTVVNSKWDVLLISAGHPA